MSYRCGVLGRKLLRTIASMRSRVRGLALVSGVAAVLGVGGVGCVSTPVLQLHSARISGVSATGVILAVTMRVNNENSFDVRVRNVRANVTIQSRFTLPYLQYNPDKWLASDASTFVPAPMTIPWVMVQPLLSTSIGSSYVSYTLNGLADVTATRLLQIQATDYGINARGTFSRGELAIAAGRGVLGGMTDDTSLLAGAPPGPFFDAMEAPPYLAGSQPLGYGGASTIQLPSWATAE
ncbi:MAG: hypothetical protein U0414_04190 [Polyangiaceae bacterium]